MLYTFQKFSVLDYKTGIKIGEKKRIDVHRDGDWHRAITAFIIRRGKKGKIEILTQERSDYVDISQKKIDQSLATQLLVEDKDNPKLAIFRGLNEELGVKKEDIAKIEIFNSLNSLRIIKKYPENKDLYNREIVDAFGVVLKKNKVFANSIKVKKVDWIEWRDFCDLVQINPRKFTKTVRLFCVNENMIEQVDNFFEKLLDNRQSRPLKRSCHYFSYYHYDLLVEFEKESKYNIEIYNTSNSMKLIKRYLDVDKDAISSVKEINEEVLTHGYLFSQRLKTN